jgi:cysteinyl-tRNA synthetase
MKLYNTLTKQKEEFKPLEGNEVRIYSCGPTVYGYAHIGNMRTNIFNDIVRKVLKYNGFQVKQVINITDVGHLTDDRDDGEEKMIMTAKAENKTPLEIAEYYTNVFMIDLKKLNIELPELMPKATDHIQEMIDYVVGLVEKGYAYETSDGIYFDVKKFKGYGALSNIDLEAQLAGARVDVNEEKRHPADFALWKKAPKEHIMQWPSPWGMGYPGWHIECSAMSLKYLGEIFDIHTGGVDHIPIHHENEIAQSEAYLGKQAVKTWMHGEFLLVNNGKMSKSLGTTFTVSDLEAKGYAPLDYRYFCLNAHYRNKLNFTWESIESAKVSYQRLLEEAAMHKYGTEDLDDDIVANFKNQFDDAVNDDLNIPKALGIVWNAVRYHVRSKKIFAFLLETDRILSIDIQKAEIKKNEDQSNQISDEIKALVEKRQEARKLKDFKASDEIRDKLKGMGVVVEDTKDGIKIKFEK